MFFKRTHKGFSHQLSTACVIYSTSLLVKHGALHKQVIPFVSLIGKQHDISLHDRVDSDLIQLFKIWQPAICLSLHQAGEN